MHASSETSSISRRPLLYTLGSSQIGFEESHLPPFLYVPSVFQQALTRAQNNLEILILLPPPTEC
ncbi:hypothetical protein ACRRTK_016386 [Alexandromys fortis]